MSKLMRTVVLVIGGLLAVLALLVVLVLVVSGRRINAPYELAGEALDVPVDSAAIARGERLATVLGCLDCHGDNLAGRQLINSAVFARLAAPNLTRGDGGIGAAYGAADFEHAIRHGVGRGGRALMIMPSGDYAGFSDGDVAELIAYLLQAPPVDNVTDPRAIGLMGRMAATLAPEGLFPALVIDHEKPHVSKVESGVTAAYGGYLAQGCVGCHAADMAGGSVPGAGGDVPRAANLTPDTSTGLGSWARDDFVRAMRAGRRPDGSTLNAAMPYRAFAAFTDDELDAIWLYLRTLPPRSTRR